jgi:large subunit ribosomal protein L17
MLRNLATNLVLRDQIETTLPKAKELKKVADKLITLAKTDTLHRRRQAMSYLFAINQKEEGNAQKLSAVHRLFTELAPRFKERAGGYTRVVRSGVRKGDASPLAIVQWVEGSVQKRERKKRRVRKSSEAAEVAA